MSSEQPLDGPSRGFPARKLVGMTVAVVLGTAVVVKVGLVIYDFSRVEFLQFCVGLLMILEAAYLVSAAASALGLLVGIPLVANRRTRRPWLARLVLLSAALMVSFACCEAASAVLLNTRATAPTVGVAAAAPALPSRMWPRQMTLPKPPESVVMPAHHQPADRTDLNIVMLGESSAAGVPYIDLSPGLLVQWKLNEVFPNRVIHMNILATGGETLENQHVRLAGLTRRPDLLVIYCGHNEFSARLAPRREPPYYYEPDPEPLPRRIGIGIEHASSVCAWIQSLADQFRVGIPPEEQGERKLVDVPVYTLAERDAILDDFRKRLELIIRHALSQGTLVLLVVPPANDAGFEPSRSFLPPEATGLERAAFAQAFEAIRRDETTDPAGCLQRYQQLRDRYPGFAETHFRMARLLEAQGRWDEAYDAYIRARDNDGLPHRALSAQQDAYREFARKYDLMLVDGQAEFHAVGPHGLLNHDLFHDLMHPSLRGQIALAQAILRELKAHRAFDWPDDKPAPAIDPAECAERYHLDSQAWHKLCHWGIMVYTMFQNARFDPAERLARRDAFARAAELINNGTPAEQVGLQNIGIPQPVPLAP